MLNFIEIEDEFEINNNILEAINIYNNNIHTTTGQKPIELFTNTSDEGFKKVNKNMKKNLKIKISILVRLIKVIKFLLKKEHHLLEEL